MRPSGPGRHSIVVFVAMVLVGCAGGSVPDLTVEDYRLSLALGADGSLEVEEVLVWADELPPDTVVEYALPSAWLDGVADVSVRVGRDAADAGSEPDELDIVAEPGGLIRWRTGSGLAGVRSLNIRYRALGVMAVSGARGRLRWPLMPRLAGPAGLVSARLTLPEGVVPVIGPLVEGADHARGWQSARVAGGYELSNGTGRESGPATLAAEFVLEDRAVPEPQWQFNAARGRELMPAFVAAGVFLVVVGLGVLWMIRFQYPHRRRATDPSAGREPVERVDPERIAVRRGLRLAGIVLLVVGALSVPVVDAWLGRFGRWPLALPGGILIVAIMFSVAGLRFPITIGENDPEKQDPNS